MNVILLLGGVLGIAFAVYFVVTSLGGFISGRRYTLEDRPDTTRIAAVIAARNEALVLPHLVKSLLAQDYPRALFDVYVVPNNCTDDTEAAALSAGAKVLHCPEPVRRKGDALRQTFAQLTATGQYDAYCVFDADNLVHPGFLHQVNNACQAGFDAAQGFRDSKNPFDSWLSGGTTIFYWFMSHVFNESRARLALNCHLNGTGFMVTDALMRRLGWHTHTLTEDLEFTAQCALEDVRIGWMPDARVYDEQPIRFVDSAVQRRRWTAGSLQCTWRYAARLWHKHSPCGLDAACLFTGNLMNYVGLISMVISAIKCWPLMKTNPAALLSGGIAYLAGMWLVCMAGAIVMLKWEKRLCRASIPTILLFPLFMLSWMPINLYASLTPPPRWRMVRHTRSVSLADLKEADTP